MLSYEKWLEAILSGRYVIGGQLGQPEYVSASELTSAPYIDRSTHSWLYPFYLDNVPANEFHSELYRFEIDSNGWWTLD